MKYLKYKRVWKVPWECSFFSVSLFKSPLDFGVMAKTIANPPNGDIYRYKRSDSYGSGIYEKSWIYASLGVNVSQEFCSL